MGQNNIDDWNWMIQIRNRMIVIESMKCLAQLRGSQVYYWLTQLAGRLSKPVMLYVTVSWVSSRDNDRACCKSKANTTTDNSESDTCDLTVTFDQWVRGRMAVVHPALVEKWVQRHTGQMGM